MTGSENRALCAAPPLHQASFEDPAKTYWGGCLGISCDRLAYLLTLVLLLLFIFLKAMSFLNTCTF